MEICKRLICFSLTTIKTEVLCFKKYTPKFEIHNFKYILQFSFSDIMQNRINSMSCEIIKHKIIAVLKNMSVCKAICFMHPDITNKNKFWTIIEKKKIPFLF